MNNKKKLGAHPFIYPLPMTLVGATVDNKPNFSTVTYCGIIQHQPPLISISLTKNHYTNIGIEENKTFSVNIPNSKMMSITDFVGIYSGRKVDKSKLFEVFYGETQTAPMIMEAPVNIECKLVDILDYGGSSKAYIGEIVETYSSPKYMKNNVLSLPKIDPFVFSIHTNFFFKIGRKIGRGWFSGLKHKEKVEINMD